jgi:flap endonuclease-1
VAAIGLKIPLLVPRRQVQLKELAGKAVAIDTYIELYQFLGTMPRFTDRQGNLTTHLVGLLYRTTRLLSLGIKPVFVLDGPFLPVEKHERLAPPALSPRLTGTLTAGVLADTVRLLDCLGLPWVQAPAEGEAQAAHICRKGDAWAVASQDYDALLFGAPRMLVNLSLAKEKKLPKGGHVLVGTYLISLKETLAELGITQEQFTLLAMLIGTDFNRGVHGIGQKRGLALVRKHKTAAKLFAATGWTDRVPWRQVREHITTMPVTDDYQLRWKGIDEGAVLEFLVKERNFNEQRVRAALGRAAEGLKRRS